MDIFFQDPSQIPLPPEEVRIRAFRAEPWPDGRRVFVYLELTPFQKRPSGKIVVLDDQGEEVANISIIETIDPKMEFTIHLRSPKPGCQYTASSTLFYTETEDAIDAEEGAQSEGRPLAPIPTKIQVVDQAKTTFYLVG
jgi:hypothetical protein